MQKKITQRNVSNILWTPCEPLILITANEIPRTKLFLQCLTRQSTLTKPKDLNIKMGERKRL